MELTDFLISEGFVRLTPNDGIKHETFQRQHTYVSIWSDNIAVSAYGRVNFTGGKESALEYLQNLKAKGTQF